MPSIISPRAESPRSQGIVMQARAKRKNTLVALVLILGLAAQSRQILTDDIPVYLGIESPVFQWGCTSAHLAAR